MHLLHSHYFCFGRTSQEIFHALQKEDPKAFKKNGVGIRKWDGVSVCEVLEFSTNFHCWDLEIPSILLDDCYRMFIRPTFTAARQVLI